MLRLVAWKSDLKTAIETAHVDHVSKLLGLGKIKSKGESDFNNDFGHLLCTAISTHNFELANIPHQKASPLVGATDMAKQNGQFSTTRWMQEIKKHTQDTSPTSRFSCEYQHGRRDRADSPSRGCKDSDRSQEYFNFVDLLLANRADIDAGDNQKLTPLRVVIWGGDTGGEAKRQLEVAEYLLEREAQVNTRDVWGYVSI